MVNYERKYKEALAKAQDMLNYKEVKREDVEYLFPELKESEDDRIIRILKKILYDCNEGVEHMIGDKEVADCVAWLEKQKPIEAGFTFDANSNILIPSDPFVFNLESCLYNFGKEIASDCLDTHILDKELNEYVTDEKVRKHIKNYIHSLSKYHPLQNEWTREDESMYTRTIGILGKCYMGIMPEKVEEELNWLKSLRPTSKDKTKKYTEDDEAHINSIIERLEGMCKKGATFTRTCFAVSEDIDWLKGVRPHSNPRWTPTNEQMRELYTMMCECRPADQQLLQDLYFGLKDLKGE